MAAKGGPFYPIGALAGSLFATLCCIGLAPLVGLVTAAGAGFLITYSVLIPLLAVFLLLGVWALRISYGRHQSLLPLGLHVPGGALLLLLTTTRFHGPLIWVGVAAVLAASAWNVRLEYAYWHRDPEIEFSRAG